jgi:hypothetical protein
MKKFTLWLSLLGLAAVLSNGCFLVSAQVLAAFDLTNPFTIDGTDDSERILVDLNDIEEYADNKDKLKGLADIAILGTFVNTNGPSGTVTAYITAANTNLADATAIQGGATKLWGPGSIGASGTPEGTVTIDWDTSAGLFDAAGKQILIDEALGDGEFTLYMVGTPNGTYDVRVDDGVVVLVLDAAK